MVGTEAESQDKRLTQREGKHGRHRETSGLQRIGVDHEGCYT